ncbi:uncharacterized protein YukE [Methanococcus voltae]|uniref:Uncharacterized protein YukE n=1 Tax=Methanococcus voltae TaxID=2188 RepID=A0A8J7UTY7_METVO|nr:hypothetical protein [Methanococcus voltae]MBP2202163.1 uncharacterized protein YukE [Methanococcus voltae]
MKINDKLITLFSLFLLLSLPSVNAADILGHEVGLDDAAMGAVGAVAGGLAVVGAAAVIGVSAPLIVVGAVAVVGAVGVNYAYRQFTGKDNPNGEEGGVTGAKNTNVSNDEFVNNTEIKSRLLEGYKIYSEEAAAADLVNIKDTIKSHIVTYSMERDGQLSQFSIDIKGSNKVYGFSAFPLQLDFKEAITGSANKSYVQINSVHVYLIDEDGRKWEGKTYADNFRLQSESEYPDDAEYTINMILKSPDPYVGKAQNLATGTFNRKDLDELINAEVKKFELFVDIEGEAVLYREDSYFDEECQSYRAKEVYDKTETIDTSLHTFDIYNGIQNGKYEVAGCSGTLPTDFIHYTTPIAYHSWSNGAVSNIVMRVWSSPCHAYNSTASYKYMALGVPENLEPVDVTLKDDFQAAILRLDSDDSASVAGIPSKGSFADIPKDYGRMTQLSLTYNKLDSTIAFENYFIIYGEVDDDLKSLPIWAVIKPDIAVCENILVTLSTDEKEEIITLLQDGEVSESDKLRLNELADISELSAKNKLDALNVKASKYSDNSKASTAYNNAIKDYGKAMEYTEKIKTETDADKIKTYFYLANDCYEPAGDYWNQAAEKYYHNLDDQGDALAENAKKLEKVAAEYEPSIWYNAGSGFKEVFNQIKTGLGLGNVDDTQLILFIFLTIVLIVIIVVKVL